MENNLNQSESQENNNEKTSNKVKNNSNPLKIFIKFFLIFILAGGLIAGVYFGYKFMDKMSKDVSDLKNKSDQSSSLLSTLDDLSRANDAKINSLSTQVNSGYNYTPQSPVFANLTVEKFLEDKNTALEDGFRFIILDLKLENKSQNDIYYNTGELKLKDADNYEYTFYGQMGATSTDYVKKDSKVLLPDNRLPLTYSTLKPGETIKGSAVFVVNRPGTKFTLIRNGETLRQINL